jgi:hypothetical protein
MFTIHTDTDIKLIDSERSKRQIAHCENARHDVFLFAVTGVPKKGIRFRMAEAKGRSKQTAAP